MVQKEINAGTTHNRPLLVTIFKGITSKAGGLVPGAALSLLRHRQLLAPAPFVSLPFTLTSKAGTRLIEQVLEKRNSLGGCQPIFRLLLSLKQN
jgi:hypothetical protein